MKNENNSKVENSTAAGNAEVEISHYWYDRILVWNKEAYQVLLYSDIAWLEASRDYCFIHFKDQPKIIVVHPLGELERVLPADQFVRVHRGYMVNLEYVDRLLGNTIYIGKQDIPVSPAYRASLLSRFRFLGSVKGLHS